MLAVAMAFAQPSIDSIWFFEETLCDGENVVTVIYEMSGGNGDVSAKLSTNGGISWDAPLDAISDTVGDLGEGISPGHHSFYWWMSTDIFDVELIDAIFRIDLSFSDTVRKTTHADFLEGDTSHVKILSPDPDGIDDGALWIPPGRDTIYVLRFIQTGTARTACPAQYTHICMPDRRRSI